jgi:hypothetical protein
MKLADFRKLQSGDKVRLALLRPRGASEAGTVQSAGLDSFGHYFASVQWDGHEAGDYSRNSFFTDGSGKEIVRRLKRELHP